MYSLFLLLFMMAETNKIKIQQPQVPVQQTEQKFDRYSMGYTDRPLYAPTQTYWNNLTYCFITAYATCTNNVLVDIDWTITRMSKWKYKTKEWTPVIPSGVVRIPANWEYMISYQPSLESKTYSSNPSYVYRIEDNWWKTRTKAKIWPTWTYSENEFIYFVDSFNSWDELMPKILQNSWWNVEWWMKLYVIKL